MARFYTTCRDVTFGSLARRASYASFLRRLSSVFAMLFALTALFLSVVAFAGFTQARVIFVMGYLFVGIPTQILIIATALYPLQVERLVRSSFAFLERTLRTLLLLFSSIFGIGVLLQFIAVAF